MLKQPLENPNFNRPEYTVKLSNGIRVSRFLSMGLVYLLAALLGILLTREGGNVAALWPPNAILVGVLLRTRPKDWFGYTGICLFANGLANCLMGDSVPVALGFVLSNGLEIVSFVSIVWWLMPLPIVLKTVAHPLMLVGAGLLSAGVGATVGATLIHITYRTPYGVVWPTWWIADVMGFAIITPVILSASWSEIRRICVQQPLEIVIYVLLIIGMTTQMFTQSSYTTLLYLIGPLLLWCSYRLGVFACALLSVIVTVIVVTITLQGLGPLNHSLGWDRSLSTIQELQLYLGIVILPALITGIEHEKQILAEVQLSEYRDQLEHRVETRTAALTAVNQQLEEREVQLQLTNEELLRATRLKDNFLASMSHELRTPLNAILGMSESLQEQIFGAITEQQKGALKTIELSGLHLLELINEILDLAKIESGQMELECKPTEIVPLCQSSLVFIKQQAFKKDIQVLYQHSDPLPNLIIDERRIRQVLINLLNNAVKFTEKGGQITLKVEYFSQQGVGGIAASPHLLKRLKTNGYVRFSVEDTGIGIAPENIDKLFQPFVQIDSALNRQYAGTGLGLALVQKNIELHGGEVNVSSELAIGSCFSFVLPCSQSSDEIVTLSNMEGERASELIQLLPPINPSPRILIAEDNEANIQILSHYLNAKGYTICLARTGKEALEQVRFDPPDLILMDIQMPEMDGLEAMQKIRQLSEGKTIPIIALTALAMKEDETKCLQAGANAYISKPVRLKDLVTIIQQHLQLLILP